MTAREGTTKSIDERVGRLEMRMDEIIIPKLDKVVDFVDENKSGIRTASLLDNKIVTVFIGAIILAGVYFLGKSGGGGL